MIAFSIILLIAVSSFLIWVKMENTEYDYGHNVRRIEDE